MGYEHLNNVILQAEILICFRFKETQLLMNNKDHGKEGEHL